MDVSLGTCARSECGLEVLLHEIFIHICRMTGCEILLKNERVIIFKKLTPVDWPILISTLHDIFQDNLSQNLVLINLDW